MLELHRPYSVWKLKLYLDLENRQPILDTVFKIPEKGERFLIEEIYIYNLLFYIVVLNLDIIGIGNGTIEEFQVLGETELWKNPDQSKDLRGELDNNIHYI